MSDVESRENVNPGAETMDVETQKTRNCAHDTLALSAVIVPVIASNWALISTRWGQTLSKLIQTRDSPEGHQNSVKGEEGYFGAGC
jgi:hypothetical protein